MGSSKTLGIIGLSIGWAIPLAGVVLGIIGLSIKKEKGKEERDITLNTLSLIIGLGAWLFWASVLMSIW